MAIGVFADIEELSRAAARLFAEAAKKAVGARGRFLVALSGGCTPGRMHEILAAPPFHNQVPWNRIHIFWGDERCVPLNDPRNNAKNAMDRLLNKVAVRAAHIHRIESDLQPRGAARLYEKQLHEFFDDHPPRFDLIFLGLGEDGHTASLFPGTPIIGETDRWVSEVYVEAQDMYRISLTAWAINQARQAVFLVSGKRKAEIVHQVLDGDVGPKRLPAQLIRPVDGELDWYIDEEAAAFFKGVPHQND
jgi:6-phosphogluconolactonase